MPARPYSAAQGNDRAAFGPFAWLIRSAFGWLALVALAGPFSNVILAVLMGVVAAMATHVSPALAGFARQGVFLSLYLALFNLLPVPPLDGSKLLLAARIPPVVYIELARFGFVLLIVAISFSDFGRWLGDWSYFGAQAIFSVFH